MKAYQKEDTRQRAEGREHPAEPREAPLGAGLAAWRDRKWPAGQRNLIKGSRPPLSRCALRGETHTSHTALRSLPRGFSLSLPVPDPGAVTDPWAEPVGTTAGNRNRGLSTAEQQQRSQLMVLITGAPVPRHSPRTCSNFLFTPFLPSLNDFCLPQEPQHVKRAHTELETHLTAPTGQGNFLRPCPSLPAAFQESLSGAVWSEVGGEPASSCPGAVRSPIQITLTPSPPL